MYVSIIPTFYCTRRCRHCYQLDAVNDKTIVDLATVDRRLSEINTYCNGHIETISVFGGELSIIDRHYVIDLLKLAKQYCRDVNINTNLSDCSLIYDAHNIGVDVAVSFNRDRPDYKYIVKTLQNTVSIRPINADTVITPYYINTTDYHDIFTEYDTLSISSVLFLQYSPSVSNPLYQITNRQYQQTMLSILDEYNSHQYNVDVANFVNDRRYCSCDHNVFIVPSGKFATIRYTRDHLEYFDQFDDISALNNLHALEMINNRQCHQCQYYNQFCLAEHIDVPREHDCCSGLKELANAIYNIRNPN